MRYILRRIKNEERRTCVRCKTPVYEGNAVVEASIESIPIAHWDLECAQKSGFQLEIGNIGGMLGHLEFFVPVTPPSHMDQIYIEEHLISEAWKKFSSIVLMRLLKKCREGYVGWAGEYPVSSLVEEIGADAPGAAEGDKKKAVDIAARAMMLWVRDYAR